MNAAKIADFYVREAKSVDLKARCIDAKASSQISREMEKANELPGILAPWNILYVITASTTSNSCKKFAQGQVQLDEDRIVCGLERYRLAHGTYPPNLDALVPACLDELPHDIMN